MTWGPYGFKVIASQSLFVEGLVGIFCQGVDKYPRFGAIQ